MILVETKDFVSWGLTAMSLLLNVWQYYDKKKIEWRTLSNLQLTIDYPTKVVPEQKTGHFMNFQKPKIENSYKYVNITFTNTGRESIVAKSLTMNVDGTLQTFEWQPGILLHCKEMAAELTGGEAIRDYEYSGPKLGTLDGLSETFVTVKSSIFMRNITRVFVTEITGKEWELPKGRLKKFLAQFDQDNPIQCIKRTI